MGIMVYSLLWVTQDLYHQPYVRTDLALSRCYSVGFRFHMWTFLATMYIELFDFV